MSVMRRSVFSNRRTPYSIRHRFNSSVMLYPAVSRKGLSDPSVTSEENNLRGFPCFSSLPYSAEMMYTAIIQYG